MRDDRVYRLQSSPETNIPVIYLCHREMRVEDNWALYFAMELARKHKTTLSMFFILPNNITRRRLTFIQEGFKEFIPAVTSLGISINIITDKAFRKKKHPLAHYVIDFHPIATTELITKDGKKDVFNNRLTFILPGNIYCIDAHNMIPCWLAYPKQAYSAKVFRQRVIKSFNDYNDSFPKLEALCSFKEPIVTYDLIEQQVDEAVKALPVKGGRTEGLKKFNDFLHHLKTNLDYYPNTRSHLSAYLNHGMISAQRCISMLPPMSFFSTFLDQIFIRRELSDNYCYFGLINSFETMSDWIRENIRNHECDRRQVISASKLEQAKSPNQTWNQLQLKMMKEGHLQGPERIAWAKEIAFWTKDINSAVGLAYYLNDKYQLDGNDPCGYVNILWSLVGLHDRPFKEKEVLGRVRHRKLT